MAVFCLDRKSTRLNSSHLVISYAVFCLKKKIRDTNQEPFSDYTHSTRDAGVRRVQSLSGTLHAGGATKTGVDKETGLSAFFFFNDTATTEIYTLSLHDALPI